MSFFYGTGIRLRIFGVAAVAACTLGTVCLLTGCRSRGISGEGQTGSRTAASTAEISTAEHTPDSAAAQSAAEEPAAENAQDAVQSAAPVQANAEQVAQNTPADWPLTLVNENHLLSADYAPALGQVTGSEKQLEIHAAQALNQLFAAAEEAGAPCFLVSGYRSVTYQQGLFDRKVQAYLESGLAQEEAERQAAGWVARPGTSEHALGLAADVVSGDWYLSHDDLTEDFENTRQFAFLSAHASEYGFILRYPKEKEALTGVHYEPWHWRWVGEYAPEIAQSGLCLEEWLAQNTP